MKRKLTLIMACLFLGIGLLTAQTQRVTGTVTSADDGEPVVGASVVVPGTNIGVITDVNGNFSLPNVPANAEVLRITFVGLVPVEVPVQPVVNVVMQSDAQSVEQVVVTGMQRVDRRLFTGAADRLTAEDVKIDGMSEISRALEGRSAGVSVQNVSGTFGTAPKIRVRGATSIYGDSKPLWVVDGVIMEDVVEVSTDDLSSGDAETLISSAIAGLNPDDIESFQILKDGSATSIYGARAMSGVIVVTTKRGQAGVSNIRYTGEYTMRVTPRYDEFNIMNSQDQIDLFREMDDKGWLKLGRTLNGSEGGVYKKMYDNWSAYNPNTGKFVTQNDSRGVSNYLRAAEMRNTNWFKELFNVNVMHQHSISMSSGNEKSTYYASMSALVDPGWTVADKVNRYTANINATYNILKDLSLNIISNASYREQKAPGTLSQDVDMVRGEISRDFDINPYSYALNASRAMDPKEYYVRNYAPFNIKNELKNNYMDLTVFSVKFQGELRWKPIRQVEFSALGSISYNSSDREHYIKDNSNQALAYRAMNNTTIRNANPFLYLDPDVSGAYKEIVLPEGGIFDKYNNTLKSWDFRVSGTYNDVFNNDHIVNVFAGMELNSTDRHGTYFRGYGMQYDLGEIPFYDYRIFKQGVEEGVDYYSLTNSYNRNVAFFGTATYSYMAKYTVNATVRYEGSNRLGKARSSRWLPTWNVGLAWNMHEENFFETLRPALSHFTLKGSYSLTADRGPSNVYNSTVIVNSYTPWRPNATDKEPGLSISYNENKNLTYEKKHELNLGFDAGFINNRLNLSLDWYRRDNFDLIGQTVTQGLGGFISRYGNVANMKSSGVEITISSTNIKKGDFSWRTDFIYGHSKTEVTKLNDNQRIMSFMQGQGWAKQGKPYRGLYSYKFLGLDYRGLPRFINENGDETITSINFQSRVHDNLVYEGPTDPTDQGSLGNVFNYKGFRLNIFITYSFGNVVRLDPVFSYSYDDLSSLSKELKNRWAVPGDERYTNIPVLVDRTQYKNISNVRYAYNAYNYSTARVAKGDFIRMKEISLTYDFPKAMISNWNISSLSLKLQATNLFLIYADKKLNGQDPEFFNSGGVATPMSKQITLTLRLGL